MIRLRGMSLAPGVAVGRCVIASPGGREPAPPSGPGGGAVRRRAPAEPVDVVVAAETLPDALAFRAPWARVVAIALAGDPGAPAPWGMPAVARLSGLFDAAQSDELLLVDGHLGIVLVDPSGAALSAYQTGFGAMSPRSRIYVEYDHQPARTVDGREIRVIARVERIADAERAVQSGADGIVVRAGSPALPATPSAGGQLRALHALIECAPGKSLIAAGDAETLHATAMLRAAVSADLTIAVDLWGSGGGIRDMQIALECAREQLADEGETFAECWIGACVPPGGRMPDLPEDTPLHRVLAPARLPLASEHVAAWIAALAADAGPLMIPVLVAPDAPTVRNLRAAITAGASGLLVSPGSVRQTKDRVRRMDATDAGRATR